MTDTQIDTRTAVDLVKMRMVSVFPVGTRDPATSRHLKHLQYSLDSLDSPVLCCRPFRPPSETDRAFLLLLLLTLKRIYLLGWIYAWLYAWLCFRGTGWANIWTTSGFLSTSSCGKCCSSFHYGDPIQSTYRLMEILFPLGRQMILPLFISKGSTEAAVRLLDGK